MLDHTAATIADTSVPAMLKIKFLNFRHEAPGSLPSGWYILDPSEAILTGTGCFEHQASAVRALSALINTTVAA